MNTLESVQTFAKTLWNHSTIIEIHTNGGFDTADGDNPLLNYIGKSYAEIPSDLQKTVPYFLLDAFIADIVADYVNLKVCKFTPAVHFTSDFNFDLSENTPADIAMLIMQWATDHNTRYECQHLGEILALAYHNNMSACPYEIDRYLSILDELKKPLGDIDTGRYSVNNLIENLDSEPTPSEIRELRQKNPVLLAHILKLGFDYDLTFYLTAVNALYDMHMQDAKRLRDGDEPKDKKTEPKPIVINITININP